MSWFAFFLVLLGLLATFFCQGAVEDNTITTGDLMERKLCRNTELSKCICGEQAEHVSNTIVALSVNTNYTLNSSLPCIISNFSNFKLVSEHGVATVKCHSNPGVILFRNFETLEITNIQFSNCGAIVPNMFLKPIQIMTPEQKAVLFISNSKSVVVRRVSVQTYTGIALFISNVQHTFIDEIEIVNENFHFTTNASCPTAGIVIYYGNPTNLSVIKMTLKNSVFKYNYNVYAARPGDADDIRIAAGLTIIVSETTTGQIYMNRNTFYKNFGVGGGGVNILVSFSNNCSSLVGISMTDNYFETNFLIDTSKSYTGSAIAMSLVNLNKAEEKTLKDRIPEIIINIRNNTVTKNEKSSSIGILSFGSVSVTVNITKLHCHDNVPFYNGMCLTAKAVQHLAKTEQIGTFRLYLNSIIADGNSMWTTLRTPTVKSKTTSRSSLFMFINIPVIVVTGTLTEPTFFNNNNVVGIVALESKLTLAGIIQFSNHWTSTAMYLADSSFLILRQNLKLSFTGNYTSDINEALIEVTKDSSSGKNYPCALQLDIDHCDIRYIIDSFNIKLFNHSILKLIPAYECLYINVPGCDVDMIKFYTHVFRNAVVRSNPVGAFNINPEGEYFYNHIYPGIDFTLCIALKDYMGHIIPGTISILLTEAKKNHLYFQNNKTMIVEASYNYTSCRNYTLQVYGTENKVTSGSLIISEIGMQPSLMLGFVVETCPKGFMLASGKCKCNQFIQELQKAHKSVQVNCDIHLNGTRTGHTTMVTFKEHFWLGFSNMETAHIANKHKNVANDSILLYSGICPFGFCNQTRISVDLTIQNDLCIGKRKGQLCGECEEGLSVVFGSTDCKQCSNTSLWTLAIYMVLGILLVFILLLLQLTINHGAFTSLVLYCNIAMFGLIDIDGMDPNIIGYESIPVSIINFNIGYPVCLYNNMTDTVKTALQFLFPVYIWILIIITVMISRFSTTVSNCIAGNSVQVLVTVCHLSYMKVLVTIVTVLTPLKVFVENSETHKIVVLYLWNENPNIPYGSTWQHMSLIVVALLFLFLFVLPYLLLSLFVPFCWRQKLIIRFRPVFETMYAPYKQKHSYWFGIRLLTVSAFALVSATTQGVNVYIGLLVFQFILILLTTIQAVINPFKNKLVGIIDLYFLINITFLYILCTFQILYGLLDDNNMKLLVLLMYSTIVLVSLAIIIYHLIKYVGIVNRCLMAKFQSFANKNQGIKMFQRSWKRKEFEPIEDDSNAVLREPLLQYSH